MNAADQIAEIEKQRVITLDAIDRLKRLAETAADFSVATQDAAHLRISEAGFHLSRLILMLGKATQ